MEDIKNSKSLNNQLNKFDADLCDEFQSKNNDIDTIKNFEVCFNAVTEDSVTNSESSKDCSNFNELDEENKLLVKNINILEKWINEINENEMRSNNRNQNHIMGSENKSEDLTKKEQKLVTKTNVKEEICKPKPNLDDFTQKEDNLQHIMCLENNPEDLTKKEQKIVTKTDEKEEICKLKPNFDDIIQKEDNLQHIINLDKMKKTIEIGEKYAKETNEAIRLQKDQNKKLTEVLESCNKQIEIIKQKIDEKNVESENFIVQLRTEKLNVEEERRDLEKKYKKSKQELEELEHQKELLNANFSKLHCKLNGINKNMDENHKLLTEKIEKTRTETKRLLNEIYLKKQLIVELNGKLAEMREAYKTEAENVHNLKIQLDNLKHKQSVMMSPIVNSQTSHVNIVLNNFKLDSDNMSGMSAECAGSPDDYEDTNQEFDDLIKTCYLLVDDYNKE
ncbi:Hypothetical protein CINCED_3A014419 [Cinara cedri]|uniref:Uncharacterized protein n=1 Tax=Cinara cedri TaxID=506608 RepID=A0A5E4MXZ6_9HEMI|nr:Hypothetical protein CINCED_3A014419 [Cinara cedri]